MIKKTFLLARQDPTFRSLVHRFHSMFFLATPHRGADSAHLLGNLLRLSVLHTSKDYIANLIPNSGANQAINDEFRHAYAGIQLWSFFETVETSMGLIVTKDSAVLGLPGERVQLLNADHRNVCKFGDPSDNTYCTIRNALVSTIDSIEKTWLSTEKGERRAQMQLLSHYLGVSERPEADLINVIEKKVEGSCEWLTDSTSFLQWRAGSNTTPKYLWLSGEPATGKSTIAGHVIRNLEGCNSDCVYFFFKGEEDNNSTISEMLRSLAWQMAWLNTDIRQMLLDMEREGDLIDKADPRSVWRAVFATRICRAKLRQPCYWVLDALDECSSYNSLFPCLAKVPQHFPLRLFLTSRPSLAIERLFSQEKIPILTESVNRESSLRDIRILLESNAPYLPVDEEPEREELVQQILEKSNGNFLWTSLILKEMETVYSKEQIHDVLKSVPEEMDGLYTRILRNVTASSRNKDLAKAVLKWTVCAVRPLTVGELKEALTLDIKKTLLRLEKTVGILCGHLVYVDSSQRVQVAHQTVRTFLFGSNKSFDFAFDRQREHTRLFEICLKYLNSEEMRTSRYNYGSVSSQSLGRSAFAHYATMHFADHLVRSTSSNDNQLTILNAFFQSNSLTWIELVARGQDLYPLIQTAKFLKTYLERRAKYCAPLGQEVQNISAWSQDLSHLVARFGKAILTSPFAIHFLIPPICPPASIIGRTFAKYPRALQMVGLSHKEWDDQLCCIGVSELQALSVACCDNKFAIGASDGNVRVYYAITFQEESTLAHGEPVRNLEFSSLKQCLATAGRTKINLWHSSSSMLLRTLAMNEHILALNFNVDNSLLRVATRANSLRFWNVADGTEVDNRHFADVDDEQGKGATYVRPPTHTAFSAELNLLAVAYRQRPVSLWDLEDSTFVGQFHRSAMTYPGPLIFALIFNSNPGLCLAAVAYDDGDVVTFDPWTQKPHASTNAVAATMASSPDGTILATGDGVGLITLYEFETLRMLYRIESFEQTIRSMVFSSNNLRFLDIRGGYCNIWEPPILVRRTDQGEASSVDISEGIPSGPQTGNTRAYDDDRAITAMTAHHEGEVVFCGREDGSVAAYSTTTGKVIQELFSYGKNVAVLLLEWSRMGSLLASIDRSGRFLVRAVVDLPSQIATVSEPVLNGRAPSAVTQLLLGPYGTRLLISMPQIDQLWCLETATLLCTRPYHAAKSTKKWVSHPSDPEKLLLLEGSHMQVFDWNAIGEQSKPEEIDLGFDTDQSQVFSSVQNDSLCINFAGSRINGLPPKLRLLPTGALDGELQRAAQAVHYDKLAKIVKVVVGHYRSCLVFLTHEGWICSLNNEDSSRRQAHYTKHFFIPFRFHRTDGELSMLVTVKGSVVIAHGDELIVFQNGLEFEEEVELEKRVKAPKPSTRLTLRRTHRST